MATDPLLRTQQVAQALGVSVSTIKRWVDLGALSASRTVGKHRLISLSEAVRFARRRNLPHEGLAALAAPGAVAVGAIDDRLRDALVDLLERGEAAGAKALIRAAFRGAGGAVAVADLLIRPVMERLGHGWMLGTLDVYQEHQASQIVNAALSEQVDRLSRLDRGPAPLALGAAPEGDPYTLSLLLGELVLREAGWDVRNLGPNLPMRSLAAAVEGYRPALVFLSINHLADAGQFSRDYMTFYEAAAARGVAVMLGGRAFGPELRARLMYAGFGERMAHLSEFARRVAPAAGAGAGGVAVGRGDRPGSADTWNG